MKRMVRILRPAFLLFLTLLMVTAGCKDDNTLTATGAVSDAEIATLVASMFGTGFSTYGLAGQLEDAATLATGGSFGKVGESSSVEGDTTVTRQKSGMYSYSYVIHILYGLNGAVFTLTYDVAGIFETPRLSSDDSSHAEFDFTNLLAAQITANGQYVRYGTQVIKAADSKRVRTTTHATFTNLLIDRTTGVIGGGTVTISVTVLPPEGVETTVEGTLTFSGGNQAMLLLNGKTYALNFDYAEATGG